MNTLSPDVEDTTSQATMVSGDVGQIMEFDESTEHHEALLAVAVAVVSCIVLAFTLVSCIYFRKWKYRRRLETDAAFYMNAGFDGFPQGPMPDKKKQTANPEGVIVNGQTLYGVSDLPPHPASELPKSTPYQIDPHGYVEQNLYASRSATNSPEHVKTNGNIPLQNNSMSSSSVQSNPSSSSSNSLNSKSSTLRDCDRVKSDGFTYSNPGAKDFTDVGIADGAESGYETIDLGDGPEERRDSFILANPTAAKVYV